MLRRATYRLGNNAYLDKFKIYKWYNKNKREGKRMRETFADVPWGMKTP
jgi:hypothetical protein